MRGFFAIGSECFTHRCNLGTLFRSAYSLGAQYVFSMGHTPDFRGDTPKSYKHIPYFKYPDRETFLKTLPKNTALIGVELGGSDINKFSHPERAIYILGNESAGLSKEIVEQCDSIITIPGKYCLNVSVAGSIVMYDRIQKSIRI